MKRECKKCIYSYRRFRPRYSCLFYKSPDPESEENKNKDCKEFKRK